MSAPNPPRAQRPLQPGRRPAPVQSGPAMVELESPRKRIRFTTIVFLIVMSIYMTRLVELQIVRGPELAATAQNSRFAGKLY